MMQKIMQRKRREGMKLLWLLLFALFSIFVSPAYAIENVLLVLASDAVPYRQAAAAMEFSLAKDNFSSQIVFVSEIESDPFSVVLKKYSPRFVVAIGSRAAVFVNKLLPSSQPLIYCMVADPQQVGINPERGQVAGVSVVKSVYEQFEIIQNAMPDIHSIGMLYRSGQEQSLRTYNEVKKQLPKKWKLEAVDIDIMASQADAIQELFSKKCDLIWTRADSSIYNRATVKSILLASLRSGTPVFGFSGSFVRAGALFGLDADPKIQGEYAAMLTKQCLGLSNQRMCLVSSGVKVVVNLVVAEQLGVRLSEEFLKKAIVVSEL